MMISDVEKEEIFEKLPALSTLKSQILAIDYVKDFRDLEDKINKHGELFEAIDQMKDLQKEAVFFEHIEKTQAHLSLEKKACDIEEELNNNPLVRQYRQRMEVTSDLLDYIVKEIEEQINMKLKELREEDGN